MRGLERVKDAQRDIRTSNVLTFTLCAAVKENGRQFQVSWNVTEDCHMTLSMNSKMVRQVILKDLRKIKIFAQFLFHTVPQVNSFCHENEALRNSEHVGEPATLFN